MKLYRMMSEKEFDNVTNDRPFAWKRKFKWFSPNQEFVLNRVRDGNFNNSNFCHNRYTHLVEYLVEDNLKVLQTVSTYEVMLARKDEPLIKVLNVVKIGESYETL